MTNYDFFMDVRVKEIEEDIFIQKQKDIRIKMTLMRMQVERKMAERDFEHRRLMEWT